MKVDVARPAAVGAERVDVTVPDLAPVAKLDAELERRPSCRHEVGLVDAHPFVEMANVGQGRFAHADNSDRFRFDELDVAARR